MKKSRLTLTLASISLTAVLAMTALTGCRSSAYIRDDEKDEEITDGNCDDETWDYLCDAHDRLIDAYATAMEMDEVGQLTDTGDDKETVFAESADYINNLMDASQSNYDADDARAIGDRMNELIEILNRMTGSNSGDQV